jgi:FkbM family methyltransferase
MRARGESTRNLPATSGEIYLQRCCVDAFVDMNDVVVFDIGANRGQWTSQLLSLIDSREIKSEKISISAFEPAPQSRTVFQETVAAHSGSEAVVLHPVALSNEKGNAKFAIWSETAGTNTLAFDENSLSQAKQVIDVDVSTIDLFREEHAIRHIALIKIDAEGNDARVIAGAEQCLQDEAIDVLQFEYNGRWVYARNYLKDVFDLVSKTPYQLGKVRADHLEVYDKWHPELERFFEANYVLLHPRVLQYFNVVQGSIKAGNVFLAK